ncbi:hypothetical protein AC792_01510 [Arthrobacter sp. RIT-PI-e]|uniref:DUF4282 domain-containing protein n=1 Tax=Arthrobacter sp. RIT-PI-e TaxID=1681197 RepID=UPI0006A1050E|nr:DUF4282 domain-containing protein [Arthrobacter sp. RIT-PI-e]KNC20279.1 hypothetical protein AC792_01510 [Arthrobacter sp. RIT-PI-e]
MKALFDFSFTTFVAPSIAKIVYLLVMAVIAVSYLLFVVTAFQASTAFGVVVLLVVGPLFALFYLVLARVGLESLIATIRTAENTGELVRRSGGTAPGGVTPPSYPPTPPTY